MRADLLGKYFTGMRVGHPNYAKWHACKRGGWLLSALKEVQPGVSMESPLRPACLWLANPAEEQRVAHLEAVLSVLTCDEKKNELPCIPKPCRNGWFISRCQFLFCFGYKLQLSVNWGGAGNDARFGNP